MPRQTGMTCWVHSQSSRVFGQAGYSESRVFRLMYLDADQKNWQQQNIQESLKLANIILCGNDNP